ncbi:sugar MFS transporter [Chitinophaga caseinilytica]|uniref:sugar MFS transporter n=1 Tax=Chitinophaga caseinilytica TaxID=2267521 RepID=UPI003C2D5D50
MSSQTIPMTAPQEGGYKQAMLIIGGLFAVFGFVTWLNSSLIQFLKLLCNLTDSQSLMVTFAFFIPYFLWSLPSSVVLKKVGFKNGMAIGLVVMAIGSILFIPAANSHSFILFLVGLFIQGAGLSLLQTATNPYVSILGPIESAAKRISIMGICNKLAGVISPLILSTILLKNATEVEEKIKSTTDAVVKTQLLDELAGRVIMPYIALTLFLLLVAFLIRRSNLPEIEAEETDASGASVPARSSLGKYPYLWLGALCIFMYVGVEVMAGDVIGIYGKSLGLSADAAKYFSSFTLGSMLVGYIIGIFTIPKVISQDTALRISAVLGILFTLGAYFTDGNTAIACIALLGLANALMWPAIFPLAIEGLGKYTKLGSAILVMGIAGGAILPQIYTGLYEKDSLFGFALHGEGVTFKTAFLYAMVPCYVYILFYAVKGHTIGKVRTAKK